jgi:hypothetical protein
VQIDVRNLSSEIHSPTLVLHHGDDRWVEVGNGRYLASHIVGAKFVGLPGADHSTVIDTGLTQGGPPAVVDELPCVLRQPVGSRGKGR